MKFSAFSFNNQNTLLVDYLIVGGGGYGQNSDSNLAGQGGGGGGFVSGSDFINLNTQYPISVGAGALVGFNAGSSSFNNLIAGGGTGPTSGFPQSNGFSPTVICQPLNQSNPSGGGGAAQTGSGALCAPFYIGGAGGNGKAWLNGVYYAGGGGAGVDGITPGVGGLGGGGTGGNNSPATNPTSGSPNTGGGGGGAYKGSSIQGATGGSGIVIIRYEGSGSKATGGTISYSGSFTYHTFTSSATFTTL